MAVKSGPTPEAAMSSPAASNITSILKETRTFPPPAEFAAQAHIKSLAEYEKLWQQGKDDPEGFWAKRAERLHWFKRWDKVLVWNEPSPLRPSPLPEAYRRRFTELHGSVKPDGPSVVR